jgi:hypothetical protein
MGLGIFGLVCGVILPLFTSLLILVAFEFLFSSLSTKTGDNTQC